MECLHDMALSRLLIYHKKVLGYDLHEAIEYSCAPLI